jgi:hypothetical protein
VTYPVVRLRFADATALGPIILLPVGGGSELLEFSGPEPAVDVIGKKIGSVAASKVAEAA